MRTHPWKRAEPDGGPYRRIAEARIVDHLALGGWAFELREGSKAEAYQTTRQALQDWVELGLPFARGPRGQRLFDLVEVLNGMKVLGLEGHHPFWRERYVRTGRRMVRDMPSYDGRRFTVRYLRSFAPAAQAGTQSLRLRLPVPVAGGAHGLVDVRPIVDPGLGEIKAPAFGRLELRTPPVAEAVRFGADIVFDHRPDTQSVLTPQERELYLKAREGFIEVTARVAKTAERLRAGRHAAKTLEKLWTYVMEQVACGCVHYDTLSASAVPDAVMDSGWADCQLMAALFISLCRACQIPARLVSGLVLYEPAPTSHYWAEVWLDGMGWRTVDFLSWDLSEGASDPNWLHTFFLRTDARLVTQVFPRQFTGHIGVAFPPRWQILNRATATGLQAECIDLDRDSYVYLDEISVTSAP